MKNLFFVFMMLFYLTGSPGFSDMRSDLMVANCLEEQYQQSLIKQSVKSKAEDSHGAENALDEKARKKNKLESAFKAAEPAFEIIIPIVKFLAAIIAMIV